MRIPILIGAPPSVTQSGRIPLKAGRYKFIVEGLTSTTISCDGLPLTEELWVLVDNSPIQLALAGERVEPSITVYAERVGD